MYYIKGISEVIGLIQNATGLSGMKCDLSSDILKRAYHDFLKTESVFGNIDFSDKIKLIDFQGLKNIAPAFFTEKNRYFTENSSLLVERLSNEFFNKALIKLRCQDNEIFDLANFLIKISVINHLSSYTNGTTGDTLGLSCIDFKDHFEEQDFIELIIHQMTHMILFIDDHSNNHMIEVNKEWMIETGLKYILGGTKFPAYLAFHSFIVGVEVLCFRRQATGLHYKGKYHGVTDRIIMVCNTFKKCLIGHIDLFSLRGQSILHDSFILFDKVSNEYNCIRTQDLS